MQLRNGESFAHEQQLKTKISFDYINALNFDYSEFHKTVSGLLNTVEMLNKMHECEISTLYSDKLSNIYALYEYIAINIENLKKNKYNKFITIAFDKSVELTKLILKKSSENKLLNIYDKIETARVILILYAIRRELSAYIIEISEIDSNKMARDNISKKCVEGMFCRNSIGLVTTNTTLTFNYAIPKSDMWLIKLNICVKYITHPNPDAYLPGIETYNHKQTNARLLKIYNRIVR